jgi:hypothetical protein
MEPEDEAPPPVFGSWRAAYAVVLGCLAVEVLLFAWVSRAF